MSKAHRPPHRNPKTAEWLENKEQVCPACFENFGTTEAGDAHRNYTNRPFTCLDPKSSGLNPVNNEFGTMVWRVNRG